MDCGFLPLIRDTLHLSIGLALVVVAVFASRKLGHIQPFFWAFLLACALGIGMEALDMRDDIRTLGDWRWRASALDLARTISMPLIALLVAMRLERRK